MTLTTTGNADDLVEDMDHGRLLDTDVLRLARHADPGVRAAVAEKLPFIMADLSDDVDAVARMLARDESDWVREAVAEFVDELDEETVSWLVTDTSPAVRRQAAVRLDLTAEQQEHLARDHDPKVVNRILLDRADLAPEAFVAAVDGLFRDGVTGQTRPDWVASLSHQMPTEVQQRLVELPRLHVRLAERSDLDDETVHRIIETGIRKAVDKLVDNPTVDASIRVAAALSRNGTARSQPHDEESR